MLNHQIGWLHKHPLNKNHKEHHKQRQPTPRNQLTNKHKPTIKRHHGLISKFPLNIWFFLEPTIDIRSRLKIVFCETSDFTNSFILNSGTLLWQLLFNCTIWRCSSHWKWGFFILYWFPRVCSRINSLPCSIFRFFQEPGPFPLHMKSLQARDNFTNRDVAQDLQHHQLEDYLITNLLNSPSRLSSNQPSPPKISHPVSIHFMPARAQLAVTNSATCCTEAFDGTWRVATKPTCF